MFNIFTGLIAPGLVLVPIAAALGKRRYWHKPERIIFIYLMCSVFFNCLSVFTADRHINNLPFLHLYTILEFWILAVFFREVYPGMKIRKVLSLLIVGFTSFAIIYVTATKSLFVYNAVPRFLSSIVITIFCIHFLATQISEPYPDKPQLPAFGNFNVITAFGLLLYFSTCSTLFGLSNYFFRYNNDIKIDTAIWNLHSVFMLIMYILFAVAFIAIKKDTT